MTCSDCLAICLIIPEIWFERSQFCRSVLTCKQIQLQIKRNEMKCNNECGPSSREAWRKWQIYWKLGTGDSEFFFVPRRCYHSWSFHLSPFVTELKIHHLYSFTYHKHFYTPLPFLPYNKRAIHYHLSLSFVFQSLEWGRKWDSECLNIWNL